MAAAELLKTVLKDNANLKAYYRFESGALTTDSSGQGKTLTNVNTAVDGTGVYGGAVDLGSTNSTKYLYIANDLGITGGACTVSIWVKNNSDIGSGAWKFWTQGDAGTFVDFQVAYEYNSGTRRLQFRRIRRGTSTAEFAYNLTMGTSNWYHIVQTYDGTTVRGYVNGAYVGSVASSGNGASNTVDGFNVGADGSDQSGGTLSAYCSSIFDDVAVFDTALSADQIKELYEGRYLGELRPNQFGTTAGLWHLNGNSTDSSGNNNHGTDTAITYSQANGKFGQGAGLARASSSKIVIGTSATLQPASALTVSFWASITSNPASYCAILGNGLSGVQRGYSFDMDVNNVNFSIGASSAWGAASTPIPSAGFHFYTGSWDGTTVKFYIDGNLKASASKNAIDYTSCGLSIGNYYTNTTSANMFDGKIEELMVASTALTANQIRQMYALGVGKYY